MEKIRSLFIISLALLVSSSIALKLECTFRHRNSHEDFYWDVMHHIYTCDATIDLTSIEEEPKIVSKISTDHVRHKSNHHVRGLLIMHHRELETFPRGVEKFFPNLNGIDLEGCGLTSITADDLKPFGELQQLSLDENKIVELPHDLFKNNLKLVRIDLEGNPILHVGPNIFKPLPDLSTVYMRHTSCTTSDSMALSRMDLKSLEWELLIECPPTFDMTIEALMESEDFNEKIKEIVKKKVIEMI